MKILIFTAVFILLLDCGKDDNPVRDNTPPPGNGGADSTAPTLLIAALPESVLVESVIVSGTAYDENGIYSVTVNNVPATLSIDSSFTTPVFTYYAKIKLALGQNTVTVVAADNSAGKNRQTKFFIVVYSPSASDHTPPVIVFTSPSDSDTVLTASSSLAGLVYDPGGSITLFTVNGISVAPNGLNWTVNVQLGYSGWNDIYFVAVDAGANVTRDTLHLYLNAPGVWDPDPPSLPPAP
jgi:hypothetical protein